jgi:hypothetical protein
MNFTIPWYAAKENTRTLARIKLNVIFFSFMFIPPFRKFRIVKPKP